MPDLLGASDDYGVESNYLMSRPSISLQSNLGPVGYVAASDIQPWLQASQVHPLAYQPIYYEEDGTAAFAPTRSAAFVPIRQSLSLENFATPIGTARYTIAQPMQPKLVNIGAPSTAFPTIATSAMPTISSMPMMIATQPAIRIAKPSTTAIVRLPLIRRF